MIANLLMSMIVLTILCIGLFIYVQNEDRKHKHSH